MEELKVTGVVIQRPLTFGRLETQSMCKKALLYGDGQLDFGGQDSSTIHWKTP